MSTKAEAGRRLKEARNALDLTLEEVCKRVPGLTISALGNYESGLRMISVDTAKKIAPVLKISAEFILTLTDDRSESALLSLYRNCDARGKHTVLRAAESESSYRLDDPGQQECA